VTVHFADFGAEPGLDFGTDVTLFAVLPAIPSSTAVATAIAVEEHVPGTGVYRAEFEDVPPGIYLLRAVAGGALRASWYVEFAGVHNELVLASLDYEQGGGGGDVTGFTESAEAELQDILSASIASIRGTVETPYFQRNSVLRLVQGDTYRDGVTRAIPFVLEDADNIIDLTNWTPQYVVHTGGQTKTLTDGTVLIGTGSTRTGYVEADPEDTAALGHGDGTALLQFVNGSGAVMTLLEVLAKVTRNPAA
jgi:hypothetical protein